MKIAIFDFEATSADINTSRITEAACILYDTDTKKQIMSFSSLVWDESYESIDPVAATITGITDDLLKTHAAHSWNAPRFILAQLGAFLLRADYIVGHNILAFDLPLLKNELERNSLELDTLPPAIDTRVDLVFPSHIVTRKLAYLATELGIFVGDAHSALDDCKTTAKLLFKFPIEEVVARSKVPSIFIRADVSFQDKDKAKEKMYRWEGAQKIWYKQIKEDQYEKEVEESSFKVIKLKDFTPAQ